MVSVGSGQEIGIARRSLRILVVDDDSGMVGALAALLGTAGYQVITAYDGPTAVRRFRDDSPDIVLFDLGMPGSDGFSVSREIRAAGSVPILVVSGDAAEMAKLRAFGAGADDYIVKPFGKAELLARIAAVTRRFHDSAGSEAPGPIEAGALWLDPGRHHARAGEAPLQLTPTEFRLLEALVRASGDTVPHLQLARAGFPADADPDPVWLTPHLARLRAKVDGGGGPPIVAVHGVGYRIKVD